MNEFFKITTDIVEEFNKCIDEAIVQTFQYIDGKCCVTLHVDESKVLEMLKKAKPAPPVYIPMQSIVDLTPHYWKCPNCDGYLGAILRHRHCHHCGQKLDWTNCQEAAK